MSDDEINPRVQAVMDAGRVTRSKALRILMALADVPGPVERQVRTDVAELDREVLSGQRRTFAEMAYRLARALDADEGEITSLSGASRELRSCLTEIWKGVHVERPSDRAVQQLVDPHR